MKLLDALSASTASSLDMRRAALLLHSMSTDDREWLLEQLSPPERSRLSPLLAELQSLGMPTDPTLVSEALSTAKSDSPQHTLAHSAMVQALLREPDHLIVTLLRCGPWAWQAALFASCTPARRRAIEAALQAATADPAPAPALREALIEGVRERAAQSTRSSQSGPGESSWQRGWRQLAARFTGRRL